MLSELPSREGSAIKEGELKAIERFAPARAIGRGAKIIWEDSCEA